MYKLLFYLGMEHKITNPQYILHLHCTYKNFHKYNLNFSTYKSTHDFFFIHHYFNLDKTISTWGLLKTLSFTKVPSNIKC